MSFDPAQQESGDILPAGARFVGKWRGGSYVVVRLIGGGANGSVYLAEREGLRVAVKVSCNPTALSLEYDRLQRFADDGRGNVIGPRCIELDDAVIGGVKRFFLTMEYIDGVPLDAFIRLRGAEWIAVCLVKMTDLLESLHRRGYIFGDVKPANILVQNDTGDVRLVDFGGVAPIGQSVKEFTEAYDRAWWAFGSRRADVHYDLTACALLGLQLAAPLGKADLERLSCMRPVDRAGWLRRHAARAEATGDGPIAGVVAVMDGEVRDMEEFRRRMARTAVERRHAPPDGVSLAGRRGAGQGRRRKRRAWDRTDWGLFAAVAVFAVTLVSVLWFGA